MFNKVALGSRIILGLIFFVFGLNGLMMFTMGNGFIPTPPPSPEMMTVMTGFMATKYLMPLVKLIEVAAGLMLLVNRKTALGVALLTPIVVNILGIHLFVDTAGAPMAIVIVLLMLVLIKAYWSSFRPLLK